ncbi:MAG: NAD(P)/FAD-dependent oxidoreductase, partial [Mahellales bacterium]
FINNEAIMQILHRPIKDAFEYLAEKYSLYLQPLNPIKRIVFISEERRTEIEGPLGFITVRGRHPQSLEKQLAQNIKSKIIFKSKKSYQDLIREFDIVVVANGDTTYSQLLTNFTTDVSVNLEGVLVKGKFDPYTVTMWLDNRYSPSGYCYMLPFDEENANISLATPINNAPIDHLWEKFIYSMGMNIKIIDKFKVENYVIGRPDNQRIGNTFLIGNAGGNIMPFLGFGQFGAMLSGIYCGQAISHNMDYNHLTRNLRRSYKNSLTLRAVMEKMDNNHFNALVNILSIPMVKKMMANTRFPVLSPISRMLKPFLVSK